MSLLNLGKWKTCTQIFREPGGVRRETFQWRTCLPIQVIGGKEGLVNGNRNPLRALVSGRAANGTSSRHLVAFMARMEGKSTLKGSNCGMRDRGRKKRV